jgi:hypothetical protein
MICSQSFMAATKTAERQNKAIQNGAEIILHAMNTHQKLFSQLHFVRFCSHIASTPYRLVDWTHIATGQCKKDVLPASSHRDCVVILNYVQCCVF